jgi:putative transcriptional regulator
MMEEMEPLDPTTTPKAQDLEAPVLLLAMPQVLDPYFHRSVVLLAKHEEEGSFGFIINKPTEIKVAEILQGMDIRWGGRRGALAHFGGPVQPQIGTVLYDLKDGDPLEGLAAERGLTEDREVVPGVGFTQNVGDLARLSVEPPAGGMRLYLGYAGWGEGQLIDEILRNDWLMAPAQSSWIFDAKPETLWERTLRSVGIDPDSLPSWTAGGSGPTN